MYRAIDTEVWDDTWFADLDPDGKLLFLYLLTNRRTTACGAFEISVRMIVNETSIEAARIEELIGTFHPRVLWFKAANLIWVRNFFRRQYKNANEKQVAALRSSLAAFPHIITIAFRKEYPHLFNEESSPPIAPDEPEIGYPEATDSLSVGVPPITVTVTRPVADTASVTEPLASDAIAPTRRAREPDPVWDTQVEIFGFTPTPDTPEHGRWQKSTGIWRKLGASPQDMQLAADLYRRKYPNAAFTAVALAGRAEQLLHGQKASLSYDPKRHREVVLENGQRGYIDI